MIRFVTYFALLTFLLSSSCNKTQEQVAETETEEQVAAPLPNIPSIVADLETDLIKAAVEEDAADDPSVWFNVAKPDASTIIGTNKKGGLAVYNLEGKEIHYFPVGRVNNVDVAYGFPLQKKSVDLVAASNRTNNSITLMAVRPADGGLYPISDGDLLSDLEEVYGICLYTSPKTGNHYVFINSKDGAIEQWSLTASKDSLIKGEVVRTLSVPSQPEGMVADRGTGLLYVGEEGGGIWKFDAEPDAPDEGSLLENSSAANPNIEYDVEGLTIFYGEEETGFLLASSQGNNTYAVFRREGENEYLGSFQIVDGSVDGTQETDGIDVYSGSLGSAFPNGLLIVQDGFNYDGAEKKSQNFKLVDWAKVMELPFWVSK